MDCLKDWIGMRELDAVTPESGLFINVLPGITNLMLDRIRPAEDTHRSKMWEDIQAVAATRFYTDALVQLRAGYNLSFFLQGQNMTLQEDPDCSYEAIICSNRKLFTSAWLFLLGNQICIELLSSAQSNQHTTVDRQKYEELRDFYQVEYEKSLKLVVDNLCIESKKCLLKGGAISYTKWLP